VKIINRYYHAAFQAEGKIEDGFIQYKTPWRNPTPINRLWMRFWGLLHWLEASRILNNYLNYILPEHNRKLDNLNLEDLPSLDDSQLLEGLYTAIQLYLDLQYDSYPIIELEKYSVWLLDYLCLHWLNGNSGLRAHDFLQGISNRTLERDMHVQRLGESLGHLQKPADLEGLTYANLQTLKESGQQGKLFWAELQDFIQHYGYAWADRYPRDPAWKLNHDALINSLIHSAQQKPDAKLTKVITDSQNIRNDAEILAKKRITRGVGAWRWWLFEKILIRAQEFFPHKENRNHDVYHNVLVIRVYALEVGKRLRVRGILEMEDDIFFLESEEIAEAFKAGGSGKTIKNLIAGRKKSYQQSLRKKPLYKGLINSSLEDRFRREMGREFTLIGEGCSPGIATGPARLVSGPGDFQNINPGDIIVCRQIRPAWSPIFSKAGGIIVEVGGLLSHGATLAREYGIPAAMNIPRVTKTIRENSDVVVNGFTGEVLVNYL
jgi:phosphohistidine swiveling domain-containing protein